MSKAGESLLRGAREALAFAKGKKIKTKIHKVKVPEEINVREIRDELHLSRQEFADQYGFKIRTLEKWEQGVRKPEGAARAYLIVIKREPEFVASTLAA